VSSHPPPRARAHALIELRGDLDLSTSQSLRRRLDEELPTRHLVVDLSAVPFIDSTALGMLARAAVQRLEHNRRVVLVGTGPVVRKILAITRLGTLLTAVDTIEEAEQLLLASSPVPS
jgi:stage II sporulation protein AA (anti-sigma F factor antagonist)